MSRIGSPGAWLEGYEGGLRSTGVPHEERMQLVAESVARLTAETYFAGYVQGGESAYNDGMAEGQSEVIHSVVWVKFGPMSAHRVSELYESIREPEWTARLADCVFTCGTASEFLARVKELTEGERP
ncbi:MAG: hypothetical protein OXI71_07570 [Gemmatimonadota bacterium]|nr:hypothetical protein [Gemmatimonadota bacterium]